jgi:hypothetical protein
MEAKIVKQSQMTGECWSVQIWGLKYCETCEFKGKRNCGGKNIIKTGKNERGFTVPLDSD